MTKRNLAYPLPFIILMMVLWACTNKKDGVAYRAYHNTTAHYNGHFNADQAMLQAETKIRSNTIEDFDSILSVIALGSPEGGQAALEDLERVISKTEKVIKKHTITGEQKKSIKKPYYNRWIDENYILLGKAHYYKKEYDVAEKLFQFVYKKYTDPNAIAMGAAWLSISLMTQDEYSKAIQILSKEELNPTALEPKTKVFYHSTLAELYIKTKKWDKAKDQLNNALTATKKKKEKARLYFVLGQIYEHLEEYSSAQNQYLKTLDSKPNPELEFQAKMKKALNAIRNGSSALIARQELLEMLENIKYSDYKDQIYFTLALMEEEQGNEGEAKKLYNKSIRSSKKNKKQKGKSFLNLADLHFDDQEYVSAQSAYDSTQKLIDPKHPRIEEVKGRAKSLTELVSYLNAIENADSLTRICALDPPAQLNEMKKVREILIAKEEARRAEEARLAAERQAEALANSIPGGFWCYNKEQRTKGYEEFLSYWDERPLKDNWRLNSKLAQMNDIPDERPNASTEGTENADNSAEKSIASADDLWLKLPCKDDKAMKALIVGREEGYYKAGLVYKEDLNDPSSAIQIWEKALNTLKDNDYTPLTYYQIYRTYWNIEQLGSGKIKSCSTCNSGYWGNQIKQKYPGTEWARFVDDPNAKDENEVKKANELTGYEEVYKLYAKRYYPEAMTACNKVLREDTTNHLICKYKILRAVCVGYVDATAGLSDQYQEALKQVIQDCPGSPEAEKAKELLEPFAPKSEKTAETTPAPAPEITFQFDENAEHYFAIEIPLSTPNINGYKAIMADYTQKFYASNKLTVTGNMLNPETQLLMTKSFKKLTDAQDFMSTFALNNNEVKEIHEKQFQYFLISKQNYVQLFKIKSLDSYKKFYQENYPK